MENIDVLAEQDYETHLPFGRSIKSCCQGDDANPPRRIFPRPKIRGAEYRLIGVTGVAGSLILDPLA